MGTWTQRKRAAAGRDWFFFFCVGALAVFFLAGVVLGQAWALREPEAVNTELNQYLRDYCALDTDEEFSGRVFLSALLIYFRYPALVLLFGLLPLGAVLLPAAAAAFGFFLAFSVSCFAGAFGEAGIPVALAVFGLRCTVTLPCFFALAVPALQRCTYRVLERFSGHGKRLQKQRSGAERWLGICVIGGILLAGALAEVFVSPALLKLVLRKYLL